MVLRAVGNLARGSAARAAALAAVPGALPQLVQLLGSAADQEAQANAFAVLAEMIEAGGTPQGAAALAAAVAAAGAARPLAAALHSRDANDALRRNATFLACKLAMHGQLPALLGVGIEQLDPQPLLTPISRPPEPSGAPADPSCSAAQAAPSRSAAVPAAPRPQRPHRVCAAPGCGATHGLRRCRGCYAVLYCSEACSSAHWRAHKPECRRVQAERAAAATPAGSNA